MTADTDNATAWLSREDLDNARERLPIVYLNIVPVRTDPHGAATHIGLLLAPTPDGSFGQSIITGRVYYGERLRSALNRHIEKDLGPVSLPRVPASLTPFGVFEYFPDPAVSGLHDPRQHAIALGYAVPVAGDCRPSQQALDLQWLPVAAATPDYLARELGGGQHLVVLAALAHLGVG